MPSRDIWAGHGNEGALWSGTKSQRQDYANEPIPARDLKLEKPQPEGKNLNYKNFKV